MRLYPGPPNSLFGEILDWMLAPLLFLWPISIIVTHNVADNIAFKAIVGSNRTGESGTRHSLNLTCEFSALVCMSSAGSVGRTGWSRYYD